MKRKKFTTQMLVMLGLLTAMEIVLSRFFSISTWDLKIGFNFVPVALAAVMYGPLAGGITAALGDFLGATLFPIGPYFPGFTLTAFLTGAMLGLFLHKKQTASRILGAVSVNQLILSLLMNTLWISVLYGSPFGPLFVTRIVQCAILIPVQFLVIGFMTRVLGRYAKRVTA